MKFNDLQDLVLDWAKNKDLLHEENAEKQFMKFIEEVFEFKSEMDNITNTKGDGDFYNDCIEEYNKKARLEMGDIFVTLIILCKQLNIDPTNCLEMAYKKISKRKGKTIDGVFIKEEDL